MCQLPTGALLVGAVTTTAIAAPRKSITNMIQIARLAAFAILFSANVAATAADNLREVSNAVVQRPLWGCQAGNDNIDTLKPAFHHSVSYEEAMYLRSAKNAYREIEPRSIQMPTTELEFLESSYGLKKTIR
jgi:hypothetical protein